MKRYILTLVLACTACISALAMSYEEARREAHYLTDKMAYELNLNADQYDYAYEINLDYLLSLRSHRDINGLYYRHRLADLRDILYDWQYNLFLAADYFLRPVIWRNSCWHFPIYAHYRRGHFFYAHPRVYHHYVGGHARSHYHGGFYAGRRPHWNKGFRGSHMGRIENNKYKRNSTFRGNGYSFNLPDKGHGKSSASVNGGRSTTQRHQTDRKSSVDNNRTNSHSMHSSRIERSANQVNKQNLAHGKSGRVTFKNSSTYSTVNRSNATNSSRNHSVSSPKRHERNASFSSTRSSGRDNGARTGRGGR